MAKKAGIKSEIMGKCRAVIENIYPAVEGGKLPIKRVSGERIDVKADIFADGHDIISAQLLHRKKGELSWNASKMTLKSNDEWTGFFHAGSEGLYEYAIKAWVDHDLTWLHGFKKKSEAGEKLDVELMIGLKYLRGIESMVRDEDRHMVENAIRLFSDSSSFYKEAVELATGPVFAYLLENYMLIHNATISHTLDLVVERKKASFSAWYEFFPRSASQEPGKHGTFKDCERIIPRLAELGYDTLYFPPVHPIGVSHRKGKNNSTTAKPGEPGSPWAIGAAEGGHKAIHPDLGTIDDFVQLVQHAKNHGIEIAMDLAYQCAPDHPYVKEHPQWFKWRPDGTVQYAENPPKKYQDVLPINFENDDWKNLWKELKSIVEYWIDKGVSIFRVDNPHTKPFVFWEWLMDEMRREHPQVIFLSEAFTRPKIMARLAKIGFQQSYTYFTWRQTSQELRKYMEELTQTELREYFRPNFWPNTPDILPYYLQRTGHSHAAVRFVLAATLSSNYGMYGPVYELLENDPYPNKEEYHNSEKYEIRHWDWFQDTPMHHLIRKINHIRKENEAFHSTYNITFCETDNDNLLAYLKLTEDKQNIMLTVVNMDPTHKQSGWVSLPLHLIDAHEGQEIKLFDLMDEATYRWNRQWNYVELDPRHLPAHIFKIKVG
ncbi:MAG: alpha-1,4-glucan--maltose-1-phosphate maltosyltransferase [Flavobacteriales bacterium]